MTQTILHQHVTKYQLEFPRRRHNKEMRILFLDTRSAQTLEHDKMLTEGVDKKDLYFLRQSKIKIYNIYCTHTASLQKIK